MSLHDVMQPIERARGLPNAHYTCADTYTRERDQILFRGWSAVAFAHDAPNPGSAFPIDFAGMPLLLVRGRDGVLNVFQNTCRHRGMILVSEPTTLKGPIRCPYHSWCYDHAGALVRTPHVGGLNVDTHERVDASELGLFRIRHHVRFGTVFVDVSGKAPPFEDAHAEFLERWSEFDRELHSGGEASRFEMSVASNWKLAVENYCESYHLPWIHPELNDISPLDVHHNIEEHTEFSGQITKGIRQVTGENGQRFPDFSGLSDRWDTEGEYISLFPNLLLGVHRDFVVAMILLPQGPERTRERVSMFYARNIDTPDWQDMIAENARIWRGVFQEDVGVVEGMQRGRHGPKFDGGRFSPVMDKPTHIFHSWVARRMEGVT